VTAWVAAQFGARLQGDPALPELVQLGLRRNPRRAHLLVSTVLGKHLPVDPRIVHGTGLELGRRVGKVLDGRSALVLGFAETATGLGHCVADALEAEYLHSTRRAVPSAEPLARFEEEHSHATTHQLLPDDPLLLARGEVLVLVDDELSTGRTALNTISALQQVRRRDRYVLAALVDLRTADDRAALETFAAEHGVQIDVVALAGGVLELPPDFAARAAAAVATPPSAEPTGTALAQLIIHPPIWPPGVRASGRHGFAPADVRAAHAAAETVAAVVAETVAAAMADRMADATADRVADGAADQTRGHVLVLGTEEFMYAPTLIALYLAERLPGVRLGSTTRSPVHAQDIPGYPIRSALSFPSHDSAADGPGVRYAYNVDGAADIVLVVDEDGDTPELHAGLLTALSARAARVHLVVLPTHRPLPQPLRGPGFGSYPAADVSWLLTDLSGIPLEAPVEEREEAVQSGGAHYAESLPIEYQPDAEYQRLFHSALDDSAARIAHAVGVVTEIVLAERGADVVLASLARAGTPVGILLRRWARFAHGLDLPHYAVSIVRGRGIDTVALCYLAAHHDPDAVVFVDGWTGKGAIARELRAAVTAANERLETAFRPELAVLADPGCCVPTFGTREDFLIPSACLNSTVSGLVSRTVLNTAVLGPGQFHGAKFYGELSGADMSNTFIDAITAQFPTVAGDVARDWPAWRRSDRTPTWRGWADVEAISARFGIGDVTLVKPGVGETTRVLLRRVPWAVLVRPDAGTALDHVRLLAAQRGVPIVEYADMAYRCVGLIHPQYTRAATGADGRAVRG
jgi:adenine/guanine phosphoribosyltransferase-like PRPP-binding protein